MIDKAILEAALALFLERGFAATTMERIAERAGVSKGTLYARFASKEPLFRKVAEDRIAVWSKSFDDADRSKPDDVEGRLGYHLRSLYKMYSADEVTQFVKLVEETSTLFPDVASFWLATGAHSYSDLIASELASVATDREASVDWRILTQIAVHAFGGWLRSECLVAMPHPQEIEAYLEGIVTTLMKSIRPVR